MTGPAFHEPVSINVGAQSRTLMFTPASMRTASRVLRGDPRLALAGGGEDVVFTMAAVGLLHTGKKDIDAARVCKWIEAEPKKYVELLEAVAEAARRYYVVVGVLREGDDDTGEAPASTSPPSTPTKPSSSDSPATE